MQVGLGMTIASIDTIHTSASAESTGNMTDLAIEGDGYFILQGDGLDRYYSRAGNFGFDTDGNLINTANGLKVMGWQTSDFKVPSDKSPQNIGTIRVRKGMMVPAQATTEVKFSKNLNADTAGTESYSIPFKVYDSLGCAHNLIITFNKSLDNNEDVIHNSWNYVITSDTGQFDTTNSVTGTIMFKDDGTFDSDNTNPSNPVSVNFTPDTGAAEINLALIFPVSHNTPRKPMSI